ncbi:hypothetical protein E2I00_010701 [Balaenoptera physalus]|uniref:Uncharacterized protein n=1 Tax=Balaenoptera physalus TaxID=9770 RepID=A0A643BTP0_BALPH|nr:hypothetical protein E2I00_010701 [Balaenoptera physalus]
MWEEKSDIFFLENGLGAFPEASLLPGCWLLPPQLGTGACGERLSPLPIPHVCLELGGAAWGGLAGLLAALGMEGAEVVKEDDSH